MQIQIISILFICVLIHVMCVILEPLIKRRNVGSIRANAYVSNKCEAAAAVSSFVPSTL